MDLLDRVLLIQGARRVDPQDGEATLGPTRSDLVCLMGSVQYVSAPALGNFSREEDPDSRAGLIPVDLLFPAALRAAVFRDSREASSQEGALRDSHTAILKEAPTSHREDLTSLKEDLDLRVAPGLKKEGDPTIRKVDPGSHQEVDQTSLREALGASKAGDLTIPNRGLDFRGLEVGLTFLKEVLEINRAEDPTILSRDQDFKGREEDLTSRQVVQVPSKAVGQDILKEVPVFHREEDSHKATPISSLVVPASLKDRTLVSRRTKILVSPGDLGGHL